MESLLAGSALALMLAFAGVAGAQEAAKQGGQMVVTYKDDVTTLDPAIGYDWQNWSIIKSLFDGLMDYANRAPWNSCPINESYDISPDGQTYTFQCVPGSSSTTGAS